jgi:hypothetical protein
MQKKRGKQLNLELADVFQAENTIPLAPVLRDAFRFICMHA